MSSTSPTTTSTSPPKRRKVTYAKAFGYLLDPFVIHQQAIEDGTAIGEGDFGPTFARYRNRLARHCGIKYNDIITIRNPEPYMPPAGAMWPRPICLGDRKFLAWI
jgi:hypothetical protein